MVSQKVPNEIEYKCYVGGDSLLETKQIITLFNSCERLLLGTLILNIDIGISGLRLEQIV